MRLDTRPVIKQSHKTKTSTEEIMKSVDKNGKSLLNLFRPSLYLEFFEHLAIA